MKCSEYYVLPDGFEIRLFGPMLAVASLLTEPMLASSGVQTWCDHAGMNSHLECTVHDVPSVEDSD